MKAITRYNNLGDYYISGDFSASDYLLHQSRFRLKKAVDLKKTFSNDFWNKTSTFSRDFLEKQKLSGIWPQARRFRLQVGSFLATGYP